MKCMKCGEVLLCTNLGPGTWSPTIMCPACNEYYPFFILNRDELSIPEKHEIWGRLYQLTQCLQVQDQLTVIEPSLLDI